MIARNLLLIVSLVPCAALLLGSGAARLGSAEPKTLDLKPKWKKGDTASYEMTRTQVRESDGMVTRKVVTRAPVEIEVLETGAEGSVLRWTQGSTVFDDPKFDDDPSARAFNAILKSLDIDVELDPSGAFVGVRNWKEFRTNGQKVRDAVLAQMAKTGTAKVTTDLLRKETDKLFATKESIEAAFTRHPALLVLPLGHAYELDKTIEYETELPNVLGGDEPFPATGAVTLKALDANTATIVFRQTPDTKEMNRVLRKWVDEVAKKNGQPAPKELPELTLEDTTEYQFDLVAGWAKSVTHARTIKQPDLTRTETLTLTRKAK